MDPQAAYALVLARIELRLAELRAALERHESTRRWEEREALDRIERGLAKLIAEVPP